MVIEKKDVYGRIALYPLNESVISKVLFRPAAPTATWIPNLDVGNHFLYRVFKLFAEYILSFVHLSYVYYRVMCLTYNNS